MAREERRCSRTSSPSDGGYRVVPNAAGRGPAAAGRDRARPHAPRGPRSASATRLINTDKNNFSPRVGFAWRLGGNDKTVLRGGFGLFHPTVAVQGLRDLLADQRVPLHAALARRRPGPRLLAGRGLRRSRRTSATRASTPTSRARTSTSTTSPSSGSCPATSALRVSYIGSTMRNLLVDRTSTRCPRARRLRPGEPDDSRGCPSPATATTWTTSTTAASGQLHAGQLELRRRWRNGLALNVAYTLAHSDSNAPDSGNSSLGGDPFDPYDIEKDRGPDPNVVKHRVVANATWDIPVGHGRKHGANMPGWANALFGGWTVSTLFQARSGNNLTPFFTSFYTTSPWNTGKPLDGARQPASAAPGGPTRSSDPNTGGSRDAFFDVTRLRAARAAAQLGNAKKGSLRGPGTWVVNFAFYKDVVTSAAASGCSSRPCSTTRSTIPQFFRVLRRRLLPAGRLRARRQTDNGTTGQSWGRARSPTRKASRRGESSA